MRRSRPTAGSSGHPVDIAARICAQAGPGEVLVSETVRALTTTVLPVQFKSRGRRQLKGIGEPIELFAVVEAAAGATSWPSKGRRDGCRAGHVSALAGGVAMCGRRRLAIGWFARSRPPGFRRTWTIGVHMPLSGEGASEGIAVRNAVQLAIDQANDAGRLAGVELALKAYDTGATTFSIGARPPHARCQAIHGQLQPSARSRLPRQRARSRSRTALGCSNAAPSPRMVA